MTSRVALDSIRSITFYSDILTQSRRTPPIPQLKCIGRPCNLFQPDVVRCVNEGGSATDVDWKCQADLPDSIRFGRVEVSCEGWSQPGDPMVLKGSCALEYRLVRIPKVVQNDDSYIPRFIRHLIDPDDPLKTLFMVLWSLVLLFVFYQVLKSCLTRSLSGAGAPTPRPTSRPSSRGWFPGHHPDGTDSPPPYSRHYKPPPSESTRWIPGFWTGLGLGGLAFSMWGRRRDPEPRVVPRRSFWDWERPNNWGGWSTPRQAAPLATASGGWFSGAGSGSRRTWSNDNRGEGTSDLGTMRSSTGWGGSTVR